MALQRRLGQGATRPWLQLSGTALIVIGAALLLVTVVIRYQGEAEVQRTEEITHFSPSPSNQQGSPSISGQTTRTEPSVVLRSPDMVKTTTTKAIPSDTLLLGLAGIGFLLVAAGAFYARVSKVGLPGGASLELAALEPKSLDAAADAVKRTAQQDPELSNASPEDRAAAMLATALEISRLSQLAKEQSPATIKAVAMALVGTPPDDTQIKQLKAGSPSPDYWDQIAKGALRRRLAH